MMYRQTWAALRRIPLAVLLHQIRRKARDILVPRFSGLYGIRLKWAERRCPPVIDTTLIPEPLLDIVTHFYRKDDEACNNAGQGIFHLMGETVDFGGIHLIDWEHCLESESDHHLWRMKLCQLEVIHSLLLGGNKSCNATTQALLGSFEAAAGFHMPSAFKTTWSPYGVSHRILAILSGLALAERTVGVSPALRSRLIAFLRRDAAFLRVNVEHDLRNNHTERNLAALCFYGMVCGGYGAAENARLDHEVQLIISQTILPDGMQIERSAMYQGLSVLSLHIFAQTPFLSKETRDFARIRGAAAESAWLMLSHKDGGIALFNDSWLGEMPCAGSVLAHVQDQDVPTLLPDAGYARLTQGAFDIWMDSGSLGPSWNPGHGHADFLSLEVDVAGHRFVVDPGTSQYSTGSRRSLERSAAAHNGPCFAGVEPVEYFDCFKVGALTSATILPQRDLAGFPLGTMGGNLATQAGEVRRIVYPLGSEEVLVGDVWYASNPLGRTRWLIPASWTITHETESMLHFGNGKAEVWMEVLDGFIEGISGDCWSRYYRSSENAHVIELNALQTEAGQASIVRFGMSRFNDPDKVDAFRSRLMAGGRI